MRPAIGSSSSSSVRRRPSATSSAGTRRLSRFAAEGRVGWRGHHGKLDHRLGQSPRGKPIARGALYRMLQNRIYRGEIGTRSKVFPANTRRSSMRRSGTRSRPASPPMPPSTAAARRAKNPSLLAGIVFDGDGHRMTPSHAVKNGVRYRYYVSHLLITGTRTDAPAARRVPATGSLSRSSRAGYAGGFRSPLTSSQRSRRKRPTPPTSGI